MTGSDGPLAAYAAGLAAELAGQGYLPGSVARHTRLLARLDGWLKDQQLAPCQLTATEVERFAEWQCAAGHPAWLSRRGMLPVLGYLRGVGVVPAAAQTPGTGPAGQVLASYRRYLGEERGLAPATVRHYERYAGLFVSQLPGAVQQDLARLSAAEMTAVVRSQCRSRSVGWARNFNTVLRSLLRFLFLDDQVPRDLSAGVLAVAGWRRSGLPKALDPQHVARLLASCDPARRAGRRDLAILTLMARLGLRSGEVAALELDDFDWRAGEVVVRGKADRRDRLPVPADVGEAVAGYLRHGRPATSSRRVFILAVAPRTGISAKTVAGVVRCACERAGLPPAGPHRLRHTAATQMLRRGAPLAEVGQVLRHVSTATTAIYAKVDMAALAGLAMPWPEVTP